MQNRTREEKRKKKEKDLLFSEPINPSKHIQLKMQQQQQKETPKRTRQTGHANLP
tara:strand:+ start:72 stop:236 length:165 start_codon:yes stop_codon:yes gene_type:complete